MSFMKTNTVNITVDGHTYNSLTDFGLAIENTDYLGEPVQDDRHRITVPGRPGLLYLDDTVFGGTVFLYRSIEIKFGGMEEPEDWDSVISAFRNLFEGRLVKLSFATDPDWYWTGKAVIDDFKHTRSLGTFSFRIPEANPYKHKDHHVELVSTVSGVSVTFANSVQKVIPTITTSAGITVTQGLKTFTFAAGTHRDPSLVFSQGNNELVFKNAANVSVDYTEGSL